MGVRGLTSYIAKNAERYLDPFELHDCDLVIDGDSLASNLYKWQSNCNSAFGGDYDQYFRSVQQFFSLLKKCNVKPYILMDGGYHRKKLRTVQKRLRAKIGAVKHINPFNCTPLFPLMMREVFIEAVKSCGLDLMRCVLEADDEVAILARKLNCPVLSYDSDFYIHNVQYIPMITLTFKVYHRKSTRKNRRKTLSQFVPREAYNYIDCCIYTIKNLVRNRLDDDMLPLFATLLGNDYINRSLFRKFYANISMRNIGKRNTQQQRRIIGLLRWLQHETLETAIEKVLGRVEMDNRVYLSRQIEASMGGYNREDSQAFDFFQLEGSVNTNRIVNVKCDYSSEVEVVSDSEEESTDEDVQEDESDEDLEEENDQQDNSDDEEEEEEECAENMSDSLYKPPEWLLDYILKAELPRYIVDLINLKMYVNSPQIENFMLNDSNEIALPILEIIFGLVNYPTTEQIELQYLTRVHRVSNVHYKRLKSTVLDIDFDPINGGITQNLQIFKFIFRDFSNANTIFELCETIPSPIRLYFLSIVYLFKYSKLVTPPYLHSIIICLCQLYIADENQQPVTRDLNLFLKKHCKFLEEFNATKANKTENAVESVNQSNNISTTLTQINESNESILFYRNNLSHFQINNKIRKKHTEFSSSIIHAFAEFQSIIFHMNTLNTILGSPFERIEVSKLFNGTFLYNMYVHLKDRPNVEYFTRNYVFNDCPLYLEFYQQILTTIKQLIPSLNEKDVKGKKSRNQRKNKKRIAKQQIEIVDRSELQSILNNEDNSDGSGEFDDVNNKFSQLLKL